MIFDYALISKDLFNKLSPRSQEVISRRFGLDSGKRETLQSIGKDHDITRERVRQIENTALSEMGSRLQGLESVFNFFHNQLKIAGGMRKEDIYIRTLGPELAHFHILFLLWLNRDLQRVRETSDLHDLWTRDKSVLPRTRDIIKNVVKKLKEKGRPILVKELEGLIPEIEPNLLFGALEVSKEVSMGPQGLWGLSEWAEINPRGTRDKAYIVLKSEGRPLHFKEIAEIINRQELFSCSRAHPQTVHNELIKEPRFILVGRGTYALQEWGYEPGTVKQVIARLLEENGSLTKEEIVEKVLQRRLVKRNTVLLNLRRSEEATENDEGRYQIRV